MKADLLKKKEENDEKKQSEAERRARIEANDVRLKQFLHNQNERTRKNYVSKIRTIERKDRDAAERK